jgi:hypothetical protein
MDTETTRHSDGTFDIVQRGPAAWQPSADDLQRLYWSEVRRATLGFAGFSRGAVRVFGLWPVVLRFGPMVDGRRPIVGGIAVRKASGAIRWSSEDGVVEVAVEGFAPLVRGPLWRFESWFHDLVGRRFLAAAEKPKPGR